MVDFHINIYVNKNVSLSHVLNQRKFRSILTYRKSGFLCSSDFKEQLDGT